MKGGADRAPRRLEESAAQAIGGSEANRMDDAVDATPGGPHVLCDSLDLGNVGDVHLEDFGHRVQALRAPPGQAHRPAE